MAIRVVGRRSRYLAVHAEQAAWYQLVVLALNVLVGAGWLVALVLVLGEELGISGLLGLPTWETGLAVRIAVGLVLALALPLFVVWFVATIAYGVYGALLVMSGRPFWYLVVGAWVRRRMGDPF